MHVHDSAHIQQASRERTGRARGVSSVALKTGKPTEPPKERASIPAWKIKRQQGQGSRSSGPTSPKAKKEDIRTCPRALTRLCPARLGGSAPLSGQRLGPGLAQPPTEAAVTGPGCLSAHVALMKLSITEPSPKFRSQ